MNYFSRERTAAMGGYADTIKSPNNIVINFILFFCCR
jgi:hypothetical protein